ncbi:MAG: 3-deoxy-D-manno-octulosonic acid transferase [Planctomyces sp.]|nr:3-deoxy-D-manno-octulosonic acid transferase [Planctomyces sp.]
MRWCLNFAYLLLLVLLSPVVVWRMLRHGRYRRGLREKLLGTGPPFLPTQSVSGLTKPTVWFHAVSVGEVVQLEKVVAGFTQQTCGRFQIVVTTSTDTGYDLALKRFGEHTVTWFPLDFSWSVNAALERIRPVMLVLMELEIWPNLIRQCHQSAIPVVVVNARMSDRSVRGYRRIRRWIAPVISRISRIAAQSNEYAERLIELGASRESTTVTGSIKFDGVAMDRGQLKTMQLRQMFGLADTEIVFMAGSTQDPEEALALDVWTALRNQWPELRLILVPRHRERFEAVASLVQSRDIPLLRRSQCDASESQSLLNIKAARPVILLDTIGELGACWGLADLAFVGGSFGNRGGQNMIEPAAYGAVILFGPNTSNFRDVVAAFRKAQACIEVSEPAQLQPTIERLLQDAKKRSELGRRAQDVVQQQQGATRRTVDLLVEMVDHNLSETTT